MDEEQRRALLARLRGMTDPQITEELAAIRARMDEFAERAEPTDEQIAAADLDIATFDIVHAEDEARHERAENIARIRSLAVRTGSVERIGAPAVVVRADPFEDLDRLRYIPPDEDGAVRDRARSMVETVRSPGTTDAERERAMHIIDTVSGAALHALYYGSPHYRSAYLKWGRAGHRGQAPFYTDEEARAVERALSLTATAGGFMLPTLLDPTLIRIGNASINPLRAISRVVSITQNVWHGVTVGNVATFWTPEAADIQDGTPTFASPSVTAAKLTGYVPGSYEIFEDSNMMAQLPGLIGEAMDFKESDAFVAGSGSNAPRGIITAISATAGSTVTATTRGSFTPGSAVDVYALVNSVPPRYENTAKWLANKAIYNIINQMSPQGGGSLFWGNFNGSGVNKPPLLGYETVNASAMTGTVTSGSIIAILGDFSQFLIVDRIGTEVEFVQNIFNGATNLPTGQRGLVAHRRVGSDVTDPNAFRFLKG